METATTTETTAAKQGFSISKVSPTLIIWGTTDKGTRWTKTYRLLTDKKEVVTDYLQAYVTAKTPLMFAIRKMLENSKCEEIDDLIKQM